MFLPYAVYAEWRSCLQHTAYERWTQGHLGVGREFSRPAAILHRPWSFMAPSKRGDSDSAYRDRKVGEPLRSRALYVYGVATAENTGRCTTLQRAANGELILVSRARVAEFMDHFGLVAHPDGPPQS